MTLRAFGGGDLAGDRLLRLIYLDEAGIGNPAHEPIVTVAGLIVDADRQLDAVESDLKEIVARHIPEPQRDKFVFHAKEIFNGGGTFTRTAWPLEKRLAIAKDLADIPAKHDLPVVVGWQDRSIQFPGVALTNRDTAAAAHAIAFIVCASAVELWMRQRTSEVCMLIVEDNSDMRALIRRTINDIQTMDADNIPAHYKGVMPFTKIKEEPFFQGKRPSSVLQLADFCAYVFKRVMMNPDEQRYRAFFDPWHRQMIAVPQSL